MRLPTTGIGRRSLPIQWLVAAVLGGPAALVSAATSSSQFNVTATPVSATLRSTTDATVGNTAFCRTSPALAFGALVTVVCATGEVVDITAVATGIPGAPMHGGTYRFVLPGSYAGGLPDFYDGYTGFGTVSTWRIVQLADRNYYELLLGW